MGTTEQDLRARIDELETEITRLRRDEGLYRAMVESATDYAIIATDLEGKIKAWNQGACNLLGWEAGEAIGQGLELIFTPEDRAAGVPGAKMVRALAEGQTGDDRWRVRRDGTRFWSRGVVMLLRGEETDSSGEAPPQGFLKILRDLTEQHEAQERLRESDERYRTLAEVQMVLVAELQHRTRNLIALVRSISSETIASSTSLDSFKLRFNGRLAALSRVQGLLSRAEQEPVTIGAMIRLELDALRAETGSGRVVLDGPEVKLRKSMVQTLALALHELATNALEHGALASETGRLQVTWRVHDGTNDAAGHWLVLQWVEDGRGEKLDPAQRGYGRDLIERALPYTLGARTRFELGAGGGVHCTIDLPLDKSRGPKDDDKQ
jgi:PAS domain S-box-containing protein